MSTLKAYQSAAQQAQLDALVLVPGPNFARALNGSFMQHERPLLVTLPAQGDPFAIVPNIEMSVFSELGFAGKVFDYTDQIGYQGAFDKAFQQTGFQKIGVEGLNMRVFVDQAIRASLPQVQIIDAEKIISDLRLHKNAQEVDSLKKAIHISEEALALTLTQLKLGMSEKMIENLLVQNLFKLGAQGLAFNPIVAANTNSANSHAHAREDYCIQSGDTLLIDYGCVYNGLNSDITRTFFINSATTEQEEVYNAVLQANLVGHQNSKPGVSAHSVDDATTKSLEQCKYANRIRHRTGHGLGRDVHEAPYIIRGNDQILEEGMVYTIEPGLYEIGNFGVRIEDDVLITKEGSLSLTSFSKEFTILQVS